MSHQASPGPHCSRCAVLQADLARARAETTRLRAELHARPRPDRPDIDAMGLSEREQQVLDLISRGHSNQQVADALYIGVNSVKTHTRGLFRKIGVSTRTEAAVWAWERQDPQRSSSDTHPDPIRRPAVAND